MNEFTRNADGTIEVPLGVLDVAAIFFLSGTEGAVANLVSMLGEEQAIRLGEYAAQLTNLEHPELLGCLCEGWQSTAPLDPTIELMQRLAPCFTRRALIAQRVCRDNPKLTAKLLPFYQVTSGLRLQD